MAYKTIYWKDKSTGGVSTRSFKSKDAWKKFKNRAGYKQHIKNNRVDETAYNKFQLDTEAVEKARSERSKIEERAAKRASATGEIKGGYDATEQAHQIAQAAGSGDTGKFASTSEADFGISTSQAENAKIAAQQQADTARNLELKYKSSGKYKDRLADTNADYMRQVDQFRQQGMEVNGLPVKFNEASGKMEYDVQTIGANMGMSPDDINRLSNMNWGQRDPRDTGQKIDDLVGGQVNANTQVGSNRWANLKNKIGSPQEAIISNLSSLDPTEAQVDPTKQDHMINLSSAGYFQDYGGSMDERLNESQMPQGLGKYAGQYGPAVMASIMTAMTGFAGAPLGAAMLTSGGSQALASAQQGGDLTDILKAGAMGAGSAGIAGGAGELVSGIGGLADDTLFNAAARGTLEGAISGTGQEALEAVVLGESFDPMDIAQQAALGGGTALASKIGGDMYDQAFGGEEGAGGPGGEATLDAGGGQPTLDADIGQESLNVPSALEVGASPGDIGGAGSLISASEQDLSRLGQLDLGYGTGAGVGGDYRSTHTQLGPSIGQDPTGPALEATGGDALTGQRTILQDPTGPGVETPFAAGMAPLADVPAAGTESLSGFTGAGMQAQQDEMDDGLTVGPAFPGMTMGSLDPTVMGRPIGAESGYTNVFGESPELAAMRAERTDQGIEYADVPAAGTETSSGFSGAEVQAQMDAAPAQTSQSDYGSLVSGILSVIPAILGTESKRKKRLPDVQIPKAYGAGAFDPASSLQIRSTGEQQINPSLTQQYMGGDMATPFELPGEEERRRAGTDLWMNPNV